MKVYVAQPIQSNGIAMLERVAEVKVNPESRPQTRQEFLHAIVDVEAVILPWHTEVMDAEALALAGKLRVIGRHGVGYENIDLQAATRRGVYVTYTPVHTPTVADTAFGLLLMAARKLSLADRFVKGKGWNVGGEWVAWKFLGLDVHHKTLGIIGLGRIGTEVAKRAAGFDMRVVYHDVVDRWETARRLGVHRVAFDELLRTADFISIHCNLTPATRGLIGTREFSLMKPTAIIINTARGPIIDPEALYTALKHGMIGGAGLDVYAQEPPALDDPLLEFDNVVSLPHIGSATLEMRQRMAEVVCTDVVNVLTGKPPVYLLNPQVMDIRPLSSN